MSSAGYRVAIDIWAKSFEEGHDLIISVKNYERKVRQNEVEEFLRLKEVAAASGMRGHYIFYNWGGFDDGAKEILQQNGIMYADAESWMVGL